MSKHDNFDATLKDILQCTVCKCLPRMAIFQCLQGHLICSFCLTALLKDELQEAPCPQPQCETLLSKARAARNTALSRVIEELPTDCHFCNQSLPRRLMKSHETDLCPMRPTACHYRLLGCVWRGPLSEATAHKEACPWPHKPGAELMSVLHSSDQIALQQRKQFNRVFDLLSSEAIVYEDIQLRPCPSEDCQESSTFEAFRNTWMVQSRIMQQVDPELPHQGHLNFESSTFSAFNNTWAVKAWVSRLTSSAIPELTYQLMLKSNNELPCEVTVCLLQGPAGDFKVNPNIKKHQFNAENDVSSHVTVSFTDSNLTLNPVSKQFPNFRIFMSLTP